MPLFYDVQFWPLDPPKTLNTMCFIGSFQISQFLSAKLYIHICKKCLKFGFKILWVKENTPWGKYISENKFLKFFVYTRIWDVQFLLTYLPPLVPFCPILLDPPTPPKIGHHLCTFPK